MVKFPSAFTRDEQLRWIAYYLRCQLPRLDIQEILGISRATYYRRLASIRTN
jgi:hypothetical protein